MYDSLSIHPKSSLPTMLRPALRSTRLPLLRLFPHTRLYSTADKTSDRVPTNDPNPRAPAPNVSSSNATPIDPMGLRDSDRPLQEVPEDGEKQRTMQAPNRAEPWSRSQQPRDRAMSGPRFEQTIMEYQVRYNSVDGAFMGNVVGIVRLGWHSNLILGMNCEEAQGKPERGTRAFRRSIE